MDKKVFRFDGKSFIIFILLFLVELVIAKTKGFIRHTFGDFLVVILLYYLVKSFVNFTPKKIAIGVLCFSFAVEILQYFKIVEILGLQDNKLMRIVIGSTFSFGDLIAYTLGIITVYFIETYKKRAA
ncbi:DUF2809 domain-containing protein [uncultured Tenacibaculum sp.]|uniref:ribosomal maturation YjgA family protein n=1 Tax=uncultured Tenacibaculum sp. TaxID=174713 RepID=UPI00262BB2F3|nr:DUF2809 domain-containing protein [uncultured Tenacibaculum sp.]